EHPRLRPSQLRRPDGPHVRAGGEDRDAALPCPDEPEGGGFRSPTNTAAPALPRVRGGRIRFTPWRSDGPVVFRMGRLRNCIAFHTGVPVRCNANGLVKRMQRIGNATCWRGFAFLAFYRFTLTDFRLCGECK